MITLSVRKDFSPTPGPRYTEEGDNSGQEFRENVLKPFVLRALSEHTSLLVDLDGTAGYATSFLEESFGGLIRVEGLSYDSLTKLLKFKSDEEPYLIDDVNSYLEEARDSKKAHE